MRLPDVGFVRLLRRSSVSGFSLQAAEQELYALAEDDGAAEPENGGIERGGQEYLGQQQGQGRGDGASGETQSP